MNKEELIKRLEQKGIGKNILLSLRKIDRKDFVPEGKINEAYEDYPLAIGYGQTISQPYTVAFMLEELELKEGDKVLEVGTGSGWNAALISDLIGTQGKIYTVEIIKELAELAKKKLKKYNNVSVLNENASHGLPEFAPYDKIILTAAPKKIAQEFKDQLADKGVLVAPVGEYEQKMIKIIKNKNNLKEFEKGYFVFVPLVDR